MAEQDRANLAQLADRYLAILASGKLDDAGSIFAPDFAWHFGASMHAAGVEGWQALVVDWLAAFPDLTPVDSSTAIDAEAGVFSVRMRWRATHQGAFMGVPATARVVENEGVSVFRVDNGVIVEEWIFEDVANLMAQLSNQPAAN